MNNVLELVSGDDSIIVGVAFRKDTLKPVLCVLDSAGIDVDTLTPDSFVELMDEQGLATIEFQSAKKIEAWITLLEGMKEALHILEKEEVK